ncbi:MAG: hypothetical protein WDW36_007745 [Sanguina aurantia]
MTVVRATEGKEADQAAGVAILAQQMLEADPEAAAAMARYQTALQRLDRAKAMAGEVEEIFKQAAKDASLSDAAIAKDQARKASELLALAEVAAAEKLLEAAEMESMLAKAEQIKWGGEVTEAAEKIESIKSAGISVVGGLAATLPLLLASGNAPSGAELLSLTSALVSCVLFGVTYRYAARDAANVQLKGGVVAAFGLVRAVAAADVLQQAAVAAAAGGSSGTAAAAASAAAAAAGGASDAAADAVAAAAGGGVDLVSVVLSAGVLGPAALYAGQSMLLFGFAAVALEAGFTQGVLKRFGSAGR